MATCTLDQLLASVESKLISTGQFSTSTCFISVNPDSCLLQASDQYAVVSPGAMRRRKDMGVAPDEFLLFLEGVIVVTLWSRLALDQVPRDDSYLDDSTYGALAAADSIISALHYYLPLSAANQEPLCFEPLRLASIDSYKRDYQGVGWGAIKISFDAWWQFALQREYPSLS